MGGRSAYHQAGFLASLVSNVINTHNLVTTHQQGSVSVITKEARGDLYMVTVWNVLQLLANTVPSSTCLVLVSHLSPVSCLVNTAFRYLENSDT